MRNLFRPALVLLGLIVLGAAPRAQQAAAPANAALSLDAFVERLSKVEAALPPRMATYHPVVEVYLQHLVAADPALGPVPTKDDYFLGQFEGKDRPDVLPLNAGRGWFRPAGLM